MGARKLLPAVARKYEFGTHHTVILMGSRNIDLRCLTLKEADELAAAGNFPYLKKKERKPRAKKK